MISRKFVDIEVPNKRAEIYKVLMKTEINVEEIFDRSMVSWFFYPRDIPRAMREALRSAEKYLIKKRIKVDSPLGRELEVRIKKSWWCRKLVDRAVGNALSFLGITGGKQLSYRFVAYRVMKIVKEYDFNEWEERIKEAIDYFLRRYKLDEDVVRLVAHISSKVTAEVFHGSRWRGVEYMKLSDVMGMGVKAELELVVPEEESKAEEESEEREIEEEEKEEWVKA